MVHLRAVRKLSYTVVDVFTDTALAGNPLAVFTNAAGVEPELMQRLARELNLSETAFVLPAGREATARIRIFTPRTELPFAGHPIVGTAFVLARSAPLGEVRLLTGVGLVDVTVERQGGFVRRCVMTQPEPTFDPGPDAAALTAALGLTPSGQAVRAANGPVHLLVPVADLAALSPPAEGSTAPLGVTTVCAYTPPDGQRVDCRVFAPGVGVPEDPATGSAAGPLGVHLLREGLVEPGWIEVHQGRRMGRPSLLEVEVAHDGPPRVGGACVPVARGFFEL